MLTAAVGSVAVFPGPKLDSTDREGSKLSQKLLEAIA